MSDIKPKNLIFIFSDQHNREKIGCYGDPYAITPNLDRLAAEGTLFESAYCNSPVCVPSRSSMITGDYAHKNGFWDNAHPYCGTPEGFGHVLTEQGISITTIGKLHYKGGCDLGLPDQRFPLHVKGGTGDLYSLVRQLGSAKPKMFAASSNGHVGESDYTTYDRNTTKAAIEFLKQEAPGKKEPWVLFLGYACPHFPLIVPQEYYDLYEGIDLPDPKQFSEAVRPLHPVLNAMRVFVGSIYADLATARKVIRLYYALTTFLDAQIGAVLDTVKQLGMEESVRVIYSSDHGDTVGDHGMFYKHSMFEGSVGVPMIVRGEGVPAGKRVRTPVSLLDVYPTVLECTGAENRRADQLPGTSLFKTLKADTNMERPIFSEYHAGGALAAEFMLRKGKWKYIYYPGYAPMLFNLEEDPNELRDLAGDETCGSILQMMHEELCKVGDPDEIDKACRADQAALVEKNGGREKILAVNDFVVYSPPPKV